MAQLGLPESFTPARLRIKSRLFPAEKPGEWEAIKVRRKEKQQQVNGTATITPTHDGQPSEEPAYEEDPLSDEGAVWPMEGGRITNWSCFFALCSHVYNTLSPTFHTPILLITQPVWTPRELERITQFFFEKFKTPGFAVMDSAMATCYAYGLHTATIIDVGATKTDVTAVSEFIAQDVGRSVAIPGCGGEAMTERLLELLGKQGFTRDMCEQLKQSPICEILPPGTPFPSAAAASTKHQPSNPAAAASTGVDGSGPNQRHTAGAAGEAPRGPGPGTEVDGETKDTENEDGVLDIANIVTSNKMNEFLARKEKEKAEKLAARKKGAVDAAQAKALKQRNSEKQQNTFIYEDFAMLDALHGSTLDSKAIAEAKAVLDEGAHKPSVSGLTDGALPSGMIAPSSPHASNSIRREITVGVERFQAIPPQVLTDITSAVHRTILAVPSASQRSQLWASLIIVGNGSSVRGFKETLLATLSARFLISPSSATMFTSELPSNLTTPLGTGMNTPQLPGHPGYGGGSHGPGVNPLLIAATTASSAQPSHHLQSQSAGQSIQQQQYQPQQHISHSQTPTSIKLAKLPDYFPEWKEHGHEEAAFLGAQVAGRVIFVVDQGLSKGFMTRTDYNEQGPSGIHDYTI